MTYVPRCQFAETISLAQGVGGDLVPVSGIGATIATIDTSGAEGGPGTPYTSRTGITQLTPPYVTDSEGSISFWLELGEYDITFADMQSPPRISSFVRGFSAVQVNTAQYAALTTPQAAPIGIIMGYGGTSDPVDPDGGHRWVICDGRELSRTTYATLFSIIGGEYGTGNGSTTFNIPNVANRFPLGAGTLGGPGASGGALGHTHQTAVHYHAIPADSTFAHLAVHNSTFGIAFEERAIGDPWTSNKMWGDLTGAWHPYADPYSTGIKVEGNTANAPSDYTSANDPAYLTMNFIIRVK